MFWCTAHRRDRYVTLAVQSMIPNGVASVSVTGKLPTGGGRMAGCRRLALSPMSIYGISSCCLPVLSFNGSKYPVMYPPPPYVIDLDRS